MYKGNKCPAQSRWKTGKDFLMRAQSQKPFVASITLILLEE